MLVYVLFVGYEIWCWRDAISKLEGLQPNPIGSMAVVSEYSAIPFLFGLLVGLHISGSCSVY